MKHLLAFTAFLLCLAVPTSNFDHGYFAIEPESYEALHTLLQKEDFNRKVALTKLLMNNALSRATKKNHEKHKRYLANKKKAKSKFDVAKR